MFEGFYLDLPVAPQQRTQQSGDEQGQRAGFGDNQRIGTGDADASVGQIVEEGDLAGVVERFLDDGNACHRRTEERIACADHFIRQRIGSGEDACLTRVQAAR